MYLYEKVAIEFGSMRCVDRHAIELYSVSKISAYSYNCTVLV